MASNEDLANLPQIIYPNLKSEVKEGDIIFFTGNDDISKIIRSFTNSLWSHIAMVVRIENLDRTLILESVQTMGVRLLPLSNYVNLMKNKEDFPKKIVIARYENLDADKVKMMLNYGINLITKPYDRDEITRIIARMTGHSTGERNRNEYICSELIYECFLKAGIDIPHNSKGFISPEDIWQDTNLKAISEIVAT